MCAHCSVKCACAVVQCIVYTLHTLKHYVLTGCDVVCVDVAGTAAVTGPRAVVMGENVTFSCSVTDPGL